MIFASIFFVRLNCLGYLNFLINFVYKFFVMLHTEFQYYLEHQLKLVEMYKGRYIVIKGKKIIGDYASRIVACRETKKNHELGSFIIQLCELESSSYTHTFQSQIVSF